MPARPDQGSLLRLGRDLYPGNVGTSEVRTGEVRAGQVGTFQAGIPQAGAPEACVGKLAAAERGIIGLRAVKGPARQLQARQVGTLQICATEVCVLRHGLRNSSPLPVHGRRPARLRRRGTSRRARHRMAALMVRFLQPSQTNEYDK